MWGRENESNWHIAGFSRSLFAAQMEMQAMSQPFIHALSDVQKQAIGDRVTLNTMFGLLRENLAVYCVKSTVQPLYRDFRAGDVRHSQADIGKVQRLLGYAPTHQLAEGVAEAMAWYVGLEK